MSQINLLLDTVLASLLPSGSVSWLYYSDRLTELPLGVFAIAIATVVLPTLSAQRARSESESGDPVFAATLHWAMGLVLLIALPATVALLLLAQPILATLFQYGAFSPEDVAKSAWSLRAYTLGLCAFMLIKVLAPGYYARQDMKSPVRIGIMAMVANMIMNPLFIFPLMWLADLGHVGLPVAAVAGGGLVVFRRCPRARPAHGRPGGRWRHGLCLGTVAGWTAPGPTQKSASRSLGR